MTQYFAAIGLMLAGDRPAGKILRISSGNFRYPELPGATVADANAFELETTFPRRRNTVTGEKFENPAEQAGKGTKTRSK